MHYQHYMRSLQYLSSDRKCEPVALTITLRSIHVVAAADYKPLASHELLYFPCPTAFNVSIKEVNLVILNILN